MIASMFSLDHRLAELRPSEAELRQARERRDAALASERPAATPAITGRTTGSTRFENQHSRVAVG